MIMKLILFLSALCITSNLMMKPARAEIDDVGVLIDHIRIVIVIDNSSRAAPIWQQTSTTLEATAKFFTYYDRRLIANQTRFVTSIIKVPVFDDLLKATQMHTTSAFRAFVDELSRRTSVPVIEVFTITSMAVLPDKAHFHFYMCDFLIPAVQDTIEAYRWIDLLVIYDSPLNLACVHQLLGSPKQKGDHSLALAVNDDNFYEVVYIIKLNWQSVVVACDEARSLQFLQLALRLGILNSEYTFIFTNPDVHLYSMEEYAHNHPNITFYRFISSKNNFTKEVIQAAREFEHQQEKYKILTPKTSSKLGLKSVLTFDQEVRISLPSAMLFDALLLIRTALDGLISKNRLRPWFDTLNKVVTCQKPRLVVQGRSLGAALVEEYVEGLTGLVKLNGTTRVRDTFVIEVLGLGSAGLAEIGRFSSEAVATHLHIPGISHQLQLDNIAKVLRHQAANVINKYADFRKQLTDQSAKHVVKVSTLLERPYVMIKSDENAKKARTYTYSVESHNFEGFCIDLLEDLAELLDFRYSLRLVSDGQYGSYNKSAGRWNGLIGEIVDGTADLAVAPLTITYAREQAVDFTKPFINLGISILYVQPFKTNPSLFSFTQPLAMEVWIAVLIAIAGVAAVFVVVSRFVDCAGIGTDIPFIRNSKTFTLLNSLQYTVGGIVHHGSSYIAPKSVPLRMISISWWFFALVDLISTNNFVFVSGFVPITLPEIFAQVCGQIIVSSYTANLAAFMTVETLISPFENAQEMAQQTKVLYGAVKGGATENFFREAKIDVYKRMWAFMKDKEVFTKSNSEGIERVRRSQGRYAYFMESVSMDYVIANENKDCALRQVGGLLDSKGYGIATAKESPMRDRLSMGILKLQENERLPFLYSKWWKSSGSSCETDDSVAKVLEMQNVAGVFFILFCGIIASIISLGIEFLWYHRKEKSYCDRLLEAFRGTSDKPANPIQFPKCCTKESLQKVHLLKDKLLPFVQCAECGRKELLKHCPIGYDYTFNDDLFISKPANLGTTFPFRRSASWDYFVRNRSISNDNIAFSNDIHHVMPLGDLPSSISLPLHQIPNKYRARRLLHIDQMCNSRRSLVLNYQPQTMKRSRSYIDFCV